MTNLEKLQDQAAAGRGLWVGLFLDPGMWVEAAGHKQDDPHLTIAHLGRNVAPAVVAAALDAVTAVRGRCFRASCQAHALARFRGGKDGDAVVLLLRGHDLRSAHVAITSGLVACGVRADDRFDFVPHMTLAKLPANVACNFLQPPQIGLEFRRLGLVCGDHRAFFDLHPPPF